MLAVSAALNPDCEHRQGDMRTVRIGRTFDAVFVHDAVMYMTTERDLRAAIETAFVHCRPGGAALFAPDCVCETFVSETEHGGHDGDGPRVPGSVAHLGSRSGGRHVHRRLRLPAARPRWIDARPARPSRRGGCSHANDGCAPSRTRGSSREWYRSITRSSNPDVTECSSPSVRRNARDQLAACNFARLPAT